MAQIAPPRTVTTLSEVRASDVSLVGGKGANLGEMIAAGFPVPPGFVVTAEAFTDALELAGVRSELAELTQRAANLQADELARIAERARDLVRSVGLPEQLADSVLAAHRDLGDVRVAVRSSATAEDTTDTSFAGMNETFTNVTRESLVDRIQQCWVSLYGDRVVAYRAEQGLTHEPAIAVVVQQMVDSDRSGVMFTVDPSAREQLVVEAAFGLGEVVVGGLVEPDTYRIDRSNLRIREQRIGHKEFRIVAGPSGDVQETLPDDLAWQRVLHDDETSALVHLGMDIERHYDAPQDIEWAFVGDRLYIVQSRPLTTLDTQGSASGDDDTPLLHGLGVGDRTATGRVRILESPRDGSRLEDGEILVAEMTSPDWVPTMRRAAALITDAGGSTCHAAIVSRELGIPAVVGTRTATHALRDGDLVTVEASSGQIFAGDHRAYIGVLQQLGDRQLCCRNTQIIGDFCEIHDFLDQHLVS